MDPVRKLLNEKRLVWACLVPLEAFRAVRGADVLLLCSTCLCSPWKV